MCLLVAIVVIGVLTAVIGDIANHLGCTVYLKDSVTATTIVALGTSMPGNADTSLTLSNTSVTSTCTRSQSVSRLLLRIYPGVECDELLTSPKTDTHTAIVPQTAGQGRPRKSLSLK